MNLIKNYILRLLILGSKSAGFAFQISIRLAVPFSECHPSLLAVVPTEGPRNPCNPSPCGANAICRERNGAGSCICLPEYQGDPYTGCRPECVVNSDCGRTRACVNNKCRDPCPGACGNNAECRVANHAPTCTCLPGYTGDPFTNCLLVQAGRLSSFFLSLFSIYYGFSTFVFLFFAHDIFPFFSGRRASSDRSMQSVTLRT